MRRGVLIHEGRFTYRGKGLRLVADLGEEWEKRTSLPLPLGAIVVSRRLDERLARTVERVLRRSVEYAFAHPEASAGFVRSHAQELSEEVTKSHIELFVNRHSAIWERKAAEPSCGCWNSKTRRHSYDTGNARTAPGPKTT